MTVLLRGKKTPTQRAIAVLRRFGPDAHIYLPGVGMLNGLQAGNYIHSNGTGPGEVDQPVGLVLDAAGGLGVELVTDPGFDTPASWATQAGWVVSGGSLTATSAAQFSNTQQSKVLVQGKTYVVSLTCTSTTGGIYYIVRPDATNGPSWTGAGTNQFIYTHSAGTSNLYIATQTAGFSATFSEISIREVTGIHATQPTTSAKPILRRGAVNLLTYSGDFSNAAWALVGTASKVGNTLNMPSLNDAVFHTATVAATASTGAVMLSGTGSLSLWLFNSTDFAIGLKQITLTSEPTLYFVNATPTVAGSTLRFGRRTGDTATSVTFGSAALFQGTYTAQQIQALGGIPLTTTAPASTALGRTYWEFDGSNDSLSLGSAPFLPTDDHVVVFGGTRGKPAGIGAGFSMGDAASSNSYYALRLEPAVLVIVRGSDGVTTNATNGLSTTFGETYIASSKGIGGQIACRKNAGVWSSSVSAPPMIINGGGIGGLWRQGTVGADFVQGNIYPVIAIKGTVSDPDLLLLEKLVGQMAGVTI